MVACSSHSAVWTKDGDLYTFGSSGNWLGFDWTHAVYSRGQTTPFGKVEPPKLVGDNADLRVQKVAICSKIFELYFA
jgi:hypothetical protein